MTDRLSAAPNASWLDEELRKEKAQVEGLRQVVDRQQVTLVDQHQRILSLEAALTKLEGQMGRIPGVEEALDHTRGELILRMAEVRQEQSKSEAEFLRNRQSEREQEARTLQEILLDLERLTPLEQGLAVRGAEDERLNETVLRLQGALDEVRRQIARGEEGRRQLADAIERNTVAVQQEELVLQEEIKRQRATADQVPSLRTALNRVEQQVAALHDMRDEMTAEFDEFKELQRRSEQARTQALTEWGRKVEGYAHQLDVWADQLRFFSDQHEKNRRVLREIQELGQEVSQQQDRLRQLQRISEEQLRRDLLELRSDLDRRWAQEGERREMALEAQGKLDDGQDQRLLMIEQHREVQDESLADLMEQIAQVRSDHLLAAERISRQQQHAWSSLSQTLHSVAAALSEPTDAKGA